MKPQQSQEEQEDVQDYFGVHHLLSGERSSLFILIKINARGNVPLPVGEGTSILRTGVVPSIPGHSVDRFEGVLTSLVHVEV